MERLSTPVKDNKQIENVGTCAANQDTEIGKQIAKAMDKARGGHFRRVPKKYPKGAWYTYDDRSCDYGCQVTEYTYWGLTSILGAQEFPGRLDNIKNEWRPNTAQKVKRTASI